MNFRLLCALISLSLFAFNAIGADSDSDAEDGEVEENSSDEENGLKTMTISRGETKRLDVSDVQGFQVVGYGAFDIKIPYKKVSQLVIENAGLQDLNITVNVDNKKKSISIADILEPTKPVRANIPKITPGSQIGNHKEWRRCWCDCQH